MPRPMTVGRPPISRRRVGTPTPVGHQAAYLPDHVTVGSRPVTSAGGLAGMTPLASAGMPGRQVQDAAYFMGLLQAKESIIIKEIERLKSETRRIERETGQIGTLESRYEAILKTVQELDGTLADYNQATENARTGVDPDEIMAYQRSLSSRNNDVASEIDRIFVAKTQREKDAALLEDQISSLHEAVEDKIQMMDPEKLRTYHELMQKMQDLHAEGRRREDEMAQLRGEIADIEAGTRGNSLQSDYKREESRASELETRLVELQEELKLARMDPKEEKDYLLEKIKKEKQRTADIEKKNKDICEEIESLKKTQEELHAEIDGMKKSGGGDTEKWRLVFQKDEEITAFLETYEEVKAQIEREHAQLKESIVALLEHISEGVLASKEQMPDQGQLEELKKDVSFKQKHLETSKRTMARLQDQLSKRTQELEKIDNMEGKIDAETKQLKNKMLTMEDEIKQFDNLKDLQDRSEITKDYLAQMLERYTKRRDFMKIKVSEISAQYENNEKKLGQNDVWKSLEKLEQKLLHQGQNIHSLQEFIETKGRQTDFESIKAKCLEIVDDLNTIAINNSQ